MRTAFLVSALAASSTMAQMVPVKRTASPDIDAQILSFALVLEHLENKFYSMLPSKAAFKAAKLDEKTYKNFLSISSHERDHVALLTGALKAAGAPVVPDCKYNFGVNDIKSFVATARALEGVGVAAYLGAAPAITNDAYLSVAASILTIEARHSSFLNTISGGSPFPSPYDAALSTNLVFTLAAQFIVPNSCNLGPVLPAGTRAYPLVKVAGSPAVGKTISLTFAAPKNGDNSLFAVFINSDVKLFAPIKDNKVTIPKGLAGVTYLVITDSKDLKESSIVAAGAILEL